MHVIILKDGNDAKRVESTIFKKEEDLLEYIFKNPDCIPNRGYKSGCPVCRK